MPAKKKQAKKKTAAKKKRRTVPPAQMVKSTSRGVVVDASQGVGNAQ